MIINTRQLAAVIDAVVDLSPCAPTKAGALAASRDLGARHFESALKKLVVGGILSSRRGPAGGYRLARGLRQITVADVAAALNDCPPASGTAEIIDCTVRAVLTSMTLEDIWRARSAREAAHG